MQSEKPKTLDISTLNTERKLQNLDLYKDQVFVERLHVKETREQLRKIVRPRGIRIRILPYDINEQIQSEGSLITVYGTTRSRNILYQRDARDVNEFINSKLHVIRDKPYETKQRTEQIKIEARITDDYTARRAVNIKKLPNGDTVGYI